MITLRLSARCPLEMQQPVALVPAYPAVAAQDKTIRGTATIHRPQQFQKGVRYVVALSLSDQRLRTRALLQECRRICGRLRQQVEQFLASLCVFEVIERQMAAVQLQSECGRAR